MAVPTRITQLEVVNTMLLGIGRSEVTQSSIDTPTTADVKAALAVLDEINKEVQMEGWYFNSEVNYPLVPDVSQNITIPDDFIRIDLPINGLYGCMDIALRGGQLYNRTTHDNIFPETMYVNAVRYLDFNDLPEPAKRYIALKATRVFQARTFGSETQDKDAKVNEARAWAVLLQYEMDTAEYNMLRDWPSVRAQRRSLYI